MVVVTGQRDASSERTSTIRSRDLIVMNACEPED